MLVLHHLFASAPSDMVLWTNSKYSQKLFVFSFADIVEILLKIWTLIIPFDSLRLYFFFSHIMTCIL